MQASRGPLSGGAGGPSQDVGRALVVHDVDASSEKGQDDCCDNVLTSDSDESWNSGRRAPGFIDLDLGSSQPFVSSLDLLPWQVPTPHETCHRIWVGSSKDDLRMVQEVRQTTSHHKWLKGVPVGAAARYVRVETVDHPGWVAWSQIKVFGNLPAS